MSDRESEAPRTAGSAMVELGGDRATWRREALRATLWVVPTLLVVAGAGLFAVTYAARPGGLPRRAGAAGVVELRLGRRGAPDPHRHRRRRDHGRPAWCSPSPSSRSPWRRRSSGPGCCATSSATSAPRCPLGIFVATFVFDVLTLGSITNAGVARRVRPAPVDQRRPRAAVHRPGRVDLLHPSRHPLDPADPGRGRDRS